MNRKIKFHTLHLFPFRLGMNKPRWHTFKGNTNASYKHIIELRHRVLRLPWHQPLSSAMDDTDADAIHTVAYIDSLMVACGRLHCCDNNTGQLRYMAVSPEFQKTGLGAGLILHLEVEALKLKLTFLHLNARDTAIKFYERFGYKNQGYSFTLWNCIEHYKMSKMINPT